MKREFYIVKRYCQIPKALRPQKNPNRKPVRVYIIGAGFIAMEHAAAAATLPGGVELPLAVVARRPAARRAFARRFPHARFHADAEAMLAEPARPDDIVVVATPPESHLRLVAAALNSGRHVLCEKPLAMDNREAARMLRLARSRRRLLGCCCTRFLETAGGIEAKRLLREGRLGDLCHVTLIMRRRRCRAGIDAPPYVPWFYNRALSGGGVLMDMGPYDFAMLNDLLDPVCVEIRDAWMANPETHLNLPKGAVYDVEQQVGATLRFHLKDGRAVPVTYERTDCTHGAERSIVELEGLRGAFAWDWPDWNNKGATIFSHDRLGRLVEKRRTLKIRGALRYDDRPLHFFHGRVQGRPSPAVVNERAVFNFRCVQAVYECIRSGRPQRVPSPPS